MNRSLSGGTQVPNQILENPYLDRDGINYLNPRAFEIPAIGTFGNLGPRNILGVGTWGFDVALSRTFRFGETQRLEFRAEAFNVTNSFRREFSVVREGNQATVLNATSLARSTLLSIRGSCSSRLSTSSKNASAGNTPMAQTGKDGWAFAPLA